MKTILHHLLLVHVCLTQPLRADGDTGFKLKVREGDTVIESRQKNSHKIMVIRPWVQSAKGIHLEVKSDKPTYALGEPVTLSFTFTNMAGAPKIMQSGNPYREFKIAVKIDGRPLKHDELSPQKNKKYEELLKNDWVPTEPIPVGKALVETMDLRTILSMSKPGKYTLTFRKWYVACETQEAVNKTKECIDFLDTTTTFTILPTETEPSQKK